MRLIDADAMLERLEAWNTKDNVDKALYNFALNRVINQPTAYDVDKVVEALMKEKILASDDVWEIYAVSLDDAIDAVKRGGE